MVHFLSLTILLLVIASDVINVTLVITSEECTDGEYNQLWEKLNKTVADLFMKDTCRSEPYNAVTIRK